MIETARRHSARLREKQLRPSIYVQGELFEAADAEQSKTYDPRYEIPF